MMKKQIRSNTLVVTLVFGALVSLGGNTNAEARCWRRCARLPSPYYAGRCSCDLTTKVPLVKAPTSIILSRGVFVSKKGTSYAVVEISDAGTEEELVKELNRRLSPADRLATSNSADFAGHDRKIAKTSIADGSVEDFPGLAALLNDLPTDTQMISHNPPITKDPDSDRVSEENRNIHIAAYLYATKKEGDNDYHLILGTTSAPSHSRFMTAEVSGLPTAGSDRAKLKEPRKVFEDYFIDSPISTNYRKFSPPIPVEVSGSLFFDVDHAAGVVGPEGLKPTTAWEIHPVTEIVLEP